VSCASTNGFSCPRTLIDVYENFVSSGNPALTRSKLDLGICEIAGGQCLFLSGFFERELQSRHNIRWYIYNGRRFYTLVAENTVERERGAKMQKMADQFEIWHGAYSSLRRHLRESQYILNLPTSES
jgi:hypothetical protein